MTPLTAFVSGLYLKLSVIGLGIFISLTETVLYNFLIKTLLPEKYLSRALFERYDESK